MTHKYLRVIKSDILVRMRRNSSQVIKMHFPCPARVGSKFFQNNSQNSNLERSSDECIEDIYFFEVNTKYISSSELKTSKFCFQVTR